MMPIYSLTACPECGSTIEQYLECIIGARERLLEEQRALLQGGAGSRGDYEQALIDLCQARITLEASREHRKAIERLEKTTRAFQ